MTFTIPERLKALEPITDAVNLASIFSGHVEEAMEDRNSLEVDLGEYKDVPIFTGALACFLSRNYNLGHKEGSKNLHVFKRFPR